MEKKKPGSGSKENVGRTKTPYKTKSLYIRGIPPEIEVTCRLLVDAELLKWKLKNNY